MDTPAIRFFRQYPNTVLAMEVIADGLKGGTLPAQRIEQFLDKTPEIARVHELLNRLNLFEALGVREKEIRHSRLLAWLLTPNGSHGGGTLYIQRFLQAVLAKNGKSLRIFEDLDLSAFHAECEDDHIDVLLINPSAQFVCVIENKIHAKQGKGQLAGYRKKAEDRFPDYDRRFVFLTLGNEKSADCDWNDCRYGAVLRAVLGNDTKAAAESEILGLLFRHYAEWIQAGGEPGGSNFFNIFKLNRYELRHSDFLAWLLNPIGAHGLSDRFFRYFLRLVDRSARGILPANAESLDWSDIEARREFENIDVLLFSARNRVAIVLENKVRAKEREGQFGDYRDFVQRHFAQDHLVLVFLDMQGRTSMEGSAVNLSYADLLPFFTEQIKELGPINEDPATVLLKEYRRFLETKLWTQKGIQAPPQIEEQVQHIIRKSAPELGGLLKEIRDWKTRLGSELGNWLLEQAEELFESKKGVCHKRYWFSFTPHEYDSIDLLRTGGGNRAKAFADRMLIYQFFVIPFGCDASRRPPQISLDVKMLVPNSRGKDLHEYLHRTAKESKPFNRAVGPKPGKHTGLLNHRLIGNDDMARCSVSELKSKLRQQLERFHRSIHPELVDFFRREVATFQDLERSQP